MNQTFGTASLPTLSQTHSEMKSFVFPMAFKRPHSEKQTGMFLKSRLNMRSSGKIRKSNTSEIQSFGISDIQGVDERKKLIHTYALPSKIFFHGKSVKKKDYSKFNFELQDLMKRFDKVRSTEHKVRVQSKSMKGGKKSSLWLSKMAFLQKQAKASD
jgi:hypothetical protein